MFFSLQIQPSPRHPPHSEKKIVRKGLAAPFLLFPSIPFPSLVDLARIREKRKSSRKKMKTKKFFLSKFYTVPYSPWNSQIIDTTLQTAHFLAIFICPTYMLSPCKTARQFPTLGLNNLSLPSLFSGAGLISWPEGGCLERRGFSVLYMPSEGT